MSDCSALDTTPAPENSSTTDAPTLGIDLNAHYDDIRRLSMWRCGRMVIANGIDPEDYLQTVYTALVVRNRGRAAFDPSKGAMSSYICMVAFQQLQNIIRKRTCATTPPLVFGAFDRDGKACALDDVDIIDHAPTAEDLAIAESLLDAVVAGVPQEHRERCEAALLHRWDGIGHWDRSQGPKGFSTRSVTHVKRSAVDLGLGTVKQREVVQRIRKAEVDELEKARARTVARRRQRAEQVELVAAREQEPEPWMSWGVEQFTAGCS